MIRFSLSTSQTPLKGIIRQEIASTPPTRVAALTRHLLALPPTLFPSESMGKMPREIRLQLNARQFQLPAELVRVYVQAGGGSG